VRRGPGDLDAILHMLITPLVGKQSTSVHNATARLNIWEGSVRSSKTICSLLAWCSSCAPDRPAISP
jgi:hypothetical protein